MPVGPTPDETPLNQRERIWQAVAAIPAGRVATYGQVARLAGLPNHARLVGRTLADAGRTGEAIAAYKQIITDKGANQHHRCEARLELGFDY